MADVLSAEHAAVLLAIQAGATPAQVAYALGIALWVVEGHVDLAGGTSWLARGQRRVRRDN